VEGMDKEKVKELVKDIQQKMGIKPDNKDLKDPGKLDSKKVNVK
jgi:hypothetical protein